MILFLIGILVFGFLFNYWWLTYTKDAPWVPMDADVVERVMKIAKIGPQDIFYDLGSGDGRLVIAAAMHKAEAYGIELDKLRALYSRAWIWILGLAKEAKIINQNIFEVDISEATVVCAYLIPHTHQKLKNKLAKLKKGTRIVAVAFEFEGWTPVQVDPRGTIFGPIMLYKVL